LLAGVVFSYIEIKKDGIQNRVGQASDNELEKMKFR
jgi:hypothetical protein